ncbi:hypothetical protein CBL_13277 [Carabus blaptoides fortunei]
MIFRSLSIWRGALESFILLKKGNNVTTICVHVSDWHGIAHNVATPNHSSYVTKYLSLLMGATKHPNRWSEGSYADTETGAESSNRVRFRLYATPLDNRMGSGGVACAT